ncbi:hypothetical protein N7507_011102 [Penicillium longicatenatum]|nr:hypothetical protein N7507_011102 [Penicillium longicatenatum]
MFTRILGFGPGNFLPSQSRKQRHDITTEQLHPLHRFPLANFEKMADGWHIDFRVNGVITHITAAVAMFMAV